jgi:hypothetical protein
MLSRDEMRAVEMKEADEGLVAHSEQEILQVWVLSEM